MRPRALSLVAVLFVARAAHADDAKTSAADALFREGRSAAEAGQYALACTKFEESQRLEPSPGTLLSLGDCEENQGHLTRALQHYRRLHDELPATDDRRPIADARVRAIELREPKLRRTAATPAPFPHDEPAPIPSTAPTTMSGGNARRTTTYVVGGIGLGFVSVGSILGIASLSLLASANATCSGNICANENQFRTAESFAIAANVALTAGIVLIASAIVIAFAPHSSATSRAALNVP